MVVADVDFPAAEETAQALREHGWTAVAHKTDVASEAEIRDLIAFCRSRYGSVDILVNNAGIYPAAPLAEQSEELLAAPICSSRTCAMTARSGANSSTRSFRRCATEGPRSTSPSAKAW
ncbi:MAG TPA: SDR family NAD(P)-dependent oxidoreductase [Jatrophihabitans sp.]|nr:SDR family NAD(P)-dependent oxidoreductase [Jatrophihabitans sp.]